MSKRSLTASKDGIQKAKRALERKNLTQLALANEEAIASWTPINNFFNGKNVSRRIFQEICHFLDLDWQEIALSTFEEGEEETDLEVPEDLQEIERTSNRAREALNPYILPRIRRDILLEKCLKSINLGVQEQKRLVMPILGSAGYGKSTILGNIYDELYQNFKQSQLGWVALVRCNDLIEPLENFSLELGEKVSGTRKLITEIAQSLSEYRGRGVLLIDTLDLVLEQRLVPILRQLFAKLLEIGATVVFTCREQDFQDFFEPYHESFAGFNPHVERHYIREFNDAEVKQAAIAFVQSREDVIFGDLPEVFAEKIIRLSADSKSLSAITHNPLLLALLCDLFASEKTIPEDLTISQLYEEYWNFRIAKSRKNRDDAPRIGQAKKVLCLNLSQQMYEQSQEHLRDFVYESQLQFSDVEFIAYSELKSDGVLVEVGGGRIIFFHQTFLEYAIARWFESTPEGEQAKIQLKAQINQIQINPSTYYIWPIFRQLLTLVQLTEFYQIYQDLNKQEILPFRALALACVSRIELESASILPDLLAIALSKNYTFQDALLTAANSAPPRHLFQVWIVIIGLLENVGEDLINKTVEITCESLCRFPPPMSFYFNQALISLQERTRKYNLDDKIACHIYGQFLSLYDKRLQALNREKIESEILLTLKNIYFQLGSHARALVIGFYLKSQVPTALQQELFLTITQQPPSNSFYERENAIKLCFNFLKDQLKAGNCSLGKTWFEVLHAPIEKRWCEVLGSAVGIEASFNCDLMQQLLSSTLIETPVHSSSEFNRCNTIAIEAAIAQGASNSVATILQEISIPTIPKNRLSTLVPILRELSNVEQAVVNPITDDVKLALANWIKPHIEQHPVELIRGLDTLAINCPQVEQLLGQILEQMLPDLSQPQVIQILTKLDTVPLQIQPFLYQNFKLKESRLALVKLYLCQAQEESQETIPKLLSLCLDSSIDVARSASWAILNLSEQKIQFDYNSCLPILAQSRVIGVRQNILKALIEQFNWKNSADIEFALQVFQILANEPAPEVVQQMYILADCCIWNHPSGSRQSDSNLTKAVLNLTHRLLQENQIQTLNMVTYNAFVSLNQMIKFNEVQEIERIGEMTRALLRQVNVSKKIDNLIITGLLHNIFKFKANFLEDLVQEDLLQTSQQPPVANQCAIVVAIANAYGKNSPLLDELLASEKTPEEVKSRILRERGV